ncbi:MAG: cell division protein FtsQ/DivIB [Minwuia sp.]|uniref:cell division protein FtsQ/DivIB n=1 Tax=Minwuia sp. TaxID=2493630 RepID=UPI003A864AFF
MSALKADKADRVLNEGGKRPKKAAASTERALPRRKRRRRMAWLGGSALALVIAAVAAVGYMENWHGQAAEAVDRAYSDVHRGFGLAVAEVTIEGRHRAGPDALRAALGVQVGDPILRLDLDEIRARIETIGWVRTAAVSRELPGRLHIRIVERVPFARWQLDGQTSLVDRDGAVILADVGARYRGLPRIVGADANLRAAELFDMLQSAPRLAAQVHTANLIRERRWDIGMANGITIRLPEEEPGEAWNRFNEVDRRDGLLAQRLKLIDLRVPGRVIVRLKSKPESETAEAERET